MTTATQTEKGWRIDHRCGECHAQLPLLSDEEPGPLALRFVPVIRCDECVARYELVVQQLNRNQQTARWLGDSGLPRALHGFRWAEFDTDSADRKKALTAAYAWAARDGRSVMIYGGLGVGKTRLAATACWERLLHQSVTWVSVAKLVTRASASFGSHERAEAVRTLAGDGPIVLDDLDKVAATDWVRAQLFAAIDNRLAAGSTMIVTTNLDAAQIAGELGDSIASRVASFRQFELGGRDRRQEALE